MNLRAIIFLVSFCFSLSIFSQEKSKDNIDSLVNTNYPEICPAFNLEDHIYSPNYYLTESYYKSRYKEIDLTSKITDNKGNGYD